MWWLVLGEIYIYQRTGETWSYYSQRQSHYYLGEETNACPLDQALSVSVSTVPNYFKIKETATKFTFLLPLNSLSDFKDESTWSILSEGFDNAINDLTILLDEFVLPEDTCINLVEGIQNGTTSIVS